MNALAACLAAYVQGANIERIRAGLQTFRASAQQAPGRMNLFDLGRYHVLVDYAHNPAGYEAVGSFVKNWSGPTIGVVGGPGARRDDDLRELGKLAAKFFDRIVVKEDDDSRGRARGDVAELIVQGIASIATDTIAPVPHSIVLKDAEAIEWELDNAPDNALVTIFSDNVSRTISSIMSRNPIPDDPAMLAIPTPPAPETEVPI